VDLYWIPLGAGGAAVVRASGRAYELVHSLIERRLPMDLYHTALEVSLGGVRFVIENAWPAPDLDTASRGVMSEGAVWFRSLGHFRLFRYEVRCWEDGTIPDIDQAIAHDSLTTDPRFARALLDVVSSVPPLTWGRRVAVGEEMWNSNSVISYLLTVCGITAAECLPPAGGRAPGWDTGIRVARAARDGIGTNGTHEQGPPPLESAPCKRQDRR
jgi:hypothetical protein